MVTVGGRNPRLLAMGGDTKPSWHVIQLDSIEEWDEDTEQWKPSPLTLKTPANEFGALAVPPVTICA